VRLLAIFESRGIAVLNCSYETDMDSGMFGAVLVLQLRDDSDSETLTLVERLMDTRLVSSVEFAPLSGKSFPSFRFPIIVSQEERGVIVQPASFVDSILATNGTTMNLLDAGKKYGHSVVKGLKNESNPLLDAGIIIQLLKATGWGIGKFEENEKGNVTFILRDPVFGIDSEQEVRTEFIVGLLRGVIEEVLSAELQVISYRFDGKSNSLVVKLSKLGKAKAGN
jgi:hypothetical protein